MARGSSKPDACRGSRLEADASFAREAHTVCAMLVADCLPVLLTDARQRRRRRARGLARARRRRDRKHRRGDAPARRSTATPLSPISARASGPTPSRSVTTCIDAFTRRAMTRAAAAFVSHAARKWLADLPRSRAARSQRCGVAERPRRRACAPSRIPARFYSYRRDRTTGRMGAFMAWRAIIRRFFVRRLSCSRRRFDRSSR